MGARGVSNEVDFGVLAYNVFGFVIGANSQWLVCRDDVMLRAAYRWFAASALQVLFGSAQGVPSQ